MTRFSNLSSTWLLMLSLLFLSACELQIDSTAERRLQHAKSKLGDIEIVVLRTPGEESFVSGALLGVEEVNSQPGKLLGREMKAHINTEGTSFEDSKSMLRSIENNPRITAVMGHPRSDIAIPASMIYERGQVVSLSSFAIAESLTGHNFKYVFRMAPSAKVVAEQFASVSSTLGYRRIVVLYGRSSINRELAFLFEDAAIKEKITLVKRASFFDKESNYRPLIAQFSNEKFDAVFIASSATAAGKMARQLREMGVRQPILGSGSLAHPDYYEAAGKAGDNTIVPVLHHVTHNLNYFNQKFTERYVAKYKKQPDHNAAQGYDSVMLLAAAIRRADSTLPPLLSSTLHYMPAWVGGTGVHSFDPHGELLGKRYFFSVWRAGKLNELPAIHAPYLLERFARSLKRGKDEEKVNFSEKFGSRLHDDDHKLYLLRLAYELLRFKRIGIIYENTEQGRKVANLALIKTVAEENDIEVIECKVPFSILSDSQLKNALINCYGILSLRIDALLVSEYPNSDAKLVKQLNSGLEFYKIPAIALSNRNADPHIGIVMTRRSDINLKDTEKMRVYDGLLRDLKVHQLAERLQGLPEITINLVTLQHADLPDDPFLQLSPDGYYQTDELLGSGGG